MRSYQTRSTTIALATLLALPLSLAANTEPGWPCIQRRVDMISAGQMWPHPIPEELPLSQPARNLAAALALRRNDEAEAKRLAEEYAKEYAGEAQPGIDELGAIYALVLERINAERARIIGGIERYASSQSMRAETINDLRAQLTEAKTAPGQDLAKISELEEKIRWEERIHNEREDALTYVCETPVLLEKRAFAMARILMELAETP